MVSVNPNPAQGFFFFDPMNRSYSGFNSQPPTANNTTTSTTNSSTSTTTSSTKTASTNTMSFAEDPSKKIRKPYTITKSRESWTDQEHDKFLEALQLFDRDWKKIEAFIGSKTVIQIRSHAQKYFLKVQKNGTSEHVPPPRPKRKAAHPYPQKAPKNAPVASQVAGPYQSSTALLETGYVYGPESSSVLANPYPGAALSSRSFNSTPPVNVSQVAKDDVGLAGSTIAHNCYSSSNESTPRPRPVGEAIDQGDRKPTRAMPDFAQVYSFIGSVFDPNATGHVQRLRQMDPINFETALLLMRNLAINLTSPEFEEHRRMLPLYDAESERAKLSRPYNIMHVAKSESAIPSV
ncbi:protein REVEILLE 3-like isoform X2 [Mangifera indica]|uniref:protein REVEILLE 3-like isoform X2 n=1 Tax=Mangifera indica TaxID=29780 RepID=UPI001CFAE7C9|nr:protein REVEILLE 3-like isoform X2 [Mangifera indica]